MTGGDVVSHESWDDPDVKAALEELKAENEKGRQLASEREDLVAQIIADGESPADYDLGEPIGYAELCPECGLAYSIPAEAPHTCEVRP